MNERYNVTVLDMQPIDPPTGGGRIRLLGLYHNLGDNLSTTYVGTYDWEGEKYRDHYLSQTFREINVPLSHAHFDEVKKLQDRIAGKTIIDVTFPKFAHLSQEYITAAKEWSVKSDIVIFSHPWIYPLIKDRLDKDKQVIVYDSQNVEGYLRYNLLGGGGIETNIVKDVVAVEYELCHFADIVLTCSHEDRVLFNRLYDVPLKKMKVIPNGVFTDKIKPVDSKQKEIIKQELGLRQRMAAIFIGSNYPPNLEAANYILTDLAPNLPDVSFLIAGGVGEAVKTNQQNVRITGRLTEDEKIKYLSASDIAINPMFSGSGTNIKMFDFMAAGLPIITTSIGARGITETPYAGIVISDQSRFISPLQESELNPQKAQFLGEANRELAERNYSWEKISPNLGILLNKKVKKDTITSNTTVGVISLKRYKMALMSTWNIRCGIAEHSRHLINALEAKNVDLWIIANTNADVQNSYLIDDIPKNVHQLWDYDYVTWKNSRIDTEGILHLLLHEEISKFNIQYHPGFYNQQILMNLVRHSIKSNIEVSITLHNSNELSGELLTEMSKLGVTILVHTAEEKKRLDNLGTKNSFYIPLGVLEFPDEDTDNCKKSLRILGFPVIGSFGFLRPHKGVLEAIEAIGILRNQYPNILFLGINALYPSKDSEQYLGECKKRIEELNLNNNVMLLTDFLDIKQIINYLHASDIIVLPYHNSKEGASAAANMVLASKRPLIISGSTIFNEIRDICYRVDNIQPATLATEILQVMSAPNTLYNMKNKILRYVEENSFTKIADQYIELLIKKHS